MLRPPLVKVAFASAFLYAIAATVEMTVPAHLSTTQVAWLVEPWLGAFIYTFTPASLPSSAISVGSAGLLLALVAFYLDHCVVDQPLWAVVGGWAPMLSGGALFQLQSAFGGWWVSLDINHSGLPLAYCVFVVGAVVVAASWLVAPELFNPRLGRPWVAAIIVGFVAIIVGQSVLNAPTTVFIVAVAIITGAGVIAGSRVQSRRDQSSGLP